MYEVNADWIDSDSYDELLTLSCCFLGTGHPTPGGLFVAMAIDLVLCLHAVCAMIGEGEVWRWIKSSFILMFVL